MASQNKRNSQKIITGIHVDIIRTYLRLKMALLILSRYRNPIRCIKVLQELVANRRKLSGNKIRKMACVDGNYYWDPYIPGLKSDALPHFFIGEANRIYPSGKGSFRFNNVMIAITKKCPYKCEHCFEWDDLNQQESLSLTDLKKIISRFQDLGTCQIQLTGGEPMLIVDSMVEIVSSSKPGTEFSIFTSGYGLTAENAVKLKKAGITTVFISLDHVDPVFHNRFRGSSGSFGWACEAVKNATEAGLVTTLSLCATSSFVSESNLLAYANLAKEMGVSFIQVLEPKAVGHYKGKEVSLATEQVRLLEEFYLKMNYDKKYREYPIVCYHGYYQRRIGCLGSGDRSLYVDSDGDLHACPFCRQKWGNALSADLDSMIRKLYEKGCPQYGPSKLSRLKEHIIQQHEMV